MYICQAGLSLILRALGLIMLACLLGHMIIPYVPLLEQPFVNVICLFMGHHIFGRPAHTFAHILALFSVKWAQMVASFPRWLTVRGCSCL